jgi:hypothetical protein
MNDINAEDFDFTVRGKHHSANQGGVNRKRKSTSTVGEKLAKTARIQKTRVTPKIPENSKVKIFSINVIHIVFSKIHS